MPNVDLITSNNETAAAIRSAMFQVAEDWKGTPYLYNGNSRQGIDCSHFVYQVLNGARQQVSAAGNLPEPQLVDYRNTSTIEASKLFFPVSIPQPADFVMWDGHVGIIVDPAKGTFIGSQTSTGVAETSYSSGYWKNRGVKGFLRFVYFF